MKGLIIKDLLNLKGLFRNLIITFLVFGGVFAVQGNSFFAGMIMLMCAFLVVTTMSYDDMAHWDKYALAMPITRSALVGAKYIIVLILIAFGALISSVLTLTMHAIKPSVDLAEGFGTIGVLIFVALFFVSILLPMIFKFGAEKARIYLMVVVALPMVLFSLAWSFIDKMGIRAPGGVSIDVIMDKLVVFGIPIAGAVFFILSFFLSKRIMAKKEL